jgi:hypothetical protein
MSRHETVMSLRFAVLNAATLRPMDSTPSTETIHALPLLLSDEISLRKQVASLRGQVVALQRELLCRDRWAREAQAQAASVRSAMLHDIAVIEAERADIQEQLRLARESHARDKVRPSPARDKVRHEADCVSSQEGWTRLWSETKLENVSLKATIAALQAGKPS